MHSPRYRLTTAGKFVCILLILMIAVAVYLVIDRYYWTNGDRAEYNISNETTGSDGQKTPDEQGATSNPENPNVPNGSKDSDDSEASAEPPDPIDATDAAIHIAIYFDPESNSLTQSAKNTLNQFIEDSTGLTNYRIVLEANCATVLDSPLPGPARTEHQALAEARGNTVAQYLSENRLKVAEVVNFGADNPANDNSTFDKRTKNRRVDIYLYQ